MKRNVYQEVTDKIVAQLEKGIIPWQMPWMCTGGAISYSTGRSYSMINQMLLGRDGEWLTYNQIHAAGGHIKKGAKAGMVVFFKQAIYTDQRTNEEGEVENIEVSIPVLRSYNVFHIEDCEGVSEKWTKQAEERENNQPIERAENVVNDYVARENGLRFKNDAPSDRAYYSPLTDMVVVPMISQYNDVEEYYSTTFHELVHSTGKSTRCNRENNILSVAFGSEDYSREELIAEIGSAMLCNTLAIDSTKAFKNSVAYIQGWLRRLRHDPKAIVVAASRAERAANYILNIKD